MIFPQVLSELDITVPLQLLISMFSDGVNSVKELANQRKSRTNELSGNAAARRVIIAMTVLVLLVQTGETLASYSGLQSNISRNLFGKSVPCSIPLIF